MNPLNADRTGQCSRIRQPPATQRSFVMFVYVHTDSRLLFYLPSCSFINTSQTRHVARLSLAISRPIPEQSPLQTPTRVMKPGSLFFYFIFKTDPIYRRLETHLPFLIAFYRRRVNTRLSHPQWRRQTGMVNSGTSTGPWVGISLWTGKTLFSFLVGYLLLTVF